MSRNSEAITIFCSRLGVANDIEPLEPKEWSDLAAKLITRDLAPENLLDFEEADFIEQLNCTSEEATRYMRLIDRSGSLAFELSKYENMGIQIITRADNEYPKQLKRKLGNACPPLFYYAGDLELLNRPAVGYVGSRDVSPEDITFTVNTVAKTVCNGYTVVSGGAKGVDSVSASTAMSEDGFVVEYLADSMLRKMRDSGLVGLIRDGRVLLMSVVVPTAGFNVGMAMMRNRYIYAQSEGTVIIRSDKGKGGTWAGATENLKRNWCPTLCRDCNYPGNKELIRLGAIPITETWDGQMSDMPRYTLNEVSPEPPQSIARQISMFDLA